MTRRGINVCTSKVECDDGNREPIHDILFLSNIVASVLPMV